MNEIICHHLGCAATFPASRGRGRPALYCEEHRSTKYAMVRKRHFPDVLTARYPQCCIDAGRKKCPQHRSVPGQRMAYIVSRGDRELVSELLDVWGVVNVLSPSGWQIDTIVRPEGEGW